MRLILGSASPRRKELLAQIGVVADEIRPADIDETPTRAELPRVYVARMAREKNQATELCANEVVLTADTIVALGRRILGKPADASEARAFLTKLSGRRHTVTTAIAVRNADRLWEKTVQTVVRFKRLSTDEIDQYIAGQEWVGKAGGYGIQGTASAFIPAINGSYTGVVGLPLCETAGLLRAAGINVDLRAT